MTWQSVSHRSGWKSKSAQRCQKSQPWRMRAAAEEAAAEAAAEAAVGAAVEAAEEASEAVVVLLSVAAEEAEEGVVGVVDLAAGAVAGVGLSAPHYPLLAALGAAEPHARQA